MIAITSETKTFYRLYSWIRDQFFQLKRDSHLLPLLKSLSVSLDRTKMQQIEYLKAKQQLEERNLVIHYRHGIPVLKIYIFMIFFVYQKLV